MKAYPIKIYDRFSSTPLGSVFLEKLSYAQYYAKELNALEPNLQAFALRGHARNVYGAFAKELKDEGSFTLVAEDLQELD